MKQEKPRYRKLAVTAALVGGAAAGLYLRRKQVLSLLRSVPSVKQTAKSVWFQHPSDIASIGAKAPMKKAAVKKASELEDYVKNAGGVVFRRVRGKVVPIRFKGLK